MVILLTESPVKKNYWEKHTLLQLCVMPCWEYTAWSCLWD